MANLSYERQDKFDKKCVESIEKTLILIEKEENISGTTQNKIKTIRELLKDPRSTLIGSQETDLQRAEKNFTILLNTLPQDIVADAKQFYKEQVAELENYLTELQNEEINEKKQEEEKYRKELQDINKAYNLLYKQSRPYNTYTHEIVTYAPKSAIEDLDSELVGPYPYKSTNIVDLLEEVETVRYYMKLGYRTPEEIEWQQYLDSLSSKPKVIKQTKKTKPVITCPVEQVKHFTQDVSLTAKQKQVYDQILFKVCKNCVKHNQGR